MEGGIKYKQIDVVHAIGTGRSKAVSREWKFRARGFGSNHAMKCVSLVLLGEGRGTW